MNASDCLEINLNNVKGIGLDLWLRFFAGLSSNSNVELLTATNCDITDTVADAIADCLEQNRQDDDDDDDEDEMEMEMIDLMTRFVLLMMMVQSFGFLPFVVFTHFVLANNTPSSIYYIYFYSLSV